MGHKGYSILTREELEKLPTPRLLALKKRLYPMSGSCWDRYSYECYYLCQKPKKCEYYKENVEVNDQIKLIKEVLSTREHVKRSQSCRVKSTAFSPEKPWKNFLLQDCLP